MSGIIAVGANDGAEFVTDSQRLLAFEPQVEAFRDLKENLAHRKNVTLVNCALGAKMATAMMHLATPDHSSSILAPKKMAELYPKVQFNGRREAVDVSTLDREMLRLGVKDFDRLVVDVQGYELEVLKGAKRTLRQIQRVKCEVNWEEVYEDCARFEDVDAFLATCGFRRTQLRRHTQGMCGDAYYRR